MFALHLSMFIVVARCVRITIVEGVRIITAKLCSHYNRKLSVCTIEELCSHTDHNARCKTEKKCLQNEDLPGTDEESPRT